MNLFEMFDDTKPLSLIDALRDFLPLAVKHLELDHIPKIKLVKELTDTHVPTFGRFTNDDQIIYAVIANRQPADILRTIAHEMVHYAQGQANELDADSGETGSPIEDQANAEGGVIMREFNTKFPQYLSAAAIQLPEGIAESTHCDVKNAVPELKSALEKRKAELNASSDQQVYDKIDKIMTRIANTYDITGQQLHDLWTDRYGEIPDTWIIENFANGKNPGRKGLSKRVGIPKKSSLTQLEKIAKTSSGERRRMAQWQLNMRRGHKK